MTKSKSAVVAGIVLLIVAAAVIYYFFFMPSQPEEIIDSVPSERPSVIETPEPAEEIQAIEVELSQSDELVRALAGELSSHPFLARWLMTDFIVSRFVTTVDLIAKGDSPRRPMDFIEKPDDFPVKESEGKVFVDPAGYARYDRIAGVISSLDAQGCATLYQKLRLPIQQAYQEMGYPEEDFDTTLKKAISQILETPVVYDRIYLERDVLTYVMVDPKLENLSAAQKHLLRMGPDNIQTIQSKLREISLYLGYSIQEPTIVD